MRRRAQDVGEREAVHVLEPGLLRLELRHRICSNREEFWIYPAGRFAVSGEERLSLLFALLLLGDAYILIGLQGCVAVQAVSALQYRRHGIEGRQHRFGVGPELALERLDLFESSFDRRVLRVPCLWRAVEVIQVPDNGFVCSCDLRRSLRRVR